MMQMKIERGIPLPPPLGRIASKYPFDKMQIGDSVLVKDPKQSKVCNAACRYAARHKVKFTTRRIVVNGEVHVRVWRVK